MFHKNAALGDIHRIHNWEVADPAALAALVPVAADVGKLAIQLAPYDLFVLKDDLPVTWQSLLTPSGGSVNIVDAGGFYTGTTVEAALQELGVLFAQVTQVIAIACGDETTDITTGVSKVTFHMPYAFTLSEVIAGLTVAQPSGAAFTVDINEAGVSILSTKITIDNTEETSITAATAPVISDAALAKGSKITIDVDQVGAAGAKGLKVYLIGKKT